MEQKEYIGSYIDELIAKARVAQQVFAGFDQAQVDKAVKAVGKAIYDEGEALARMAVDESHMGDFEDKILKNKGKATAMWEYLHDKKSVGVIDRDEEKKMITIAKPMGVIGAITPVTNPVMTPMHNAMIALKGANAIIISPHPAAKLTGQKSVEVMRSALREIGYPEDILQCIEPEMCSIDASNALMERCDVVVATGGPGMVKAAYSSGTPAYGVGAGNMQAIVDEDADPAAVAPKILRGRNYDNGVLCTCEQCFIAHENVYDKLTEELTKIGAYYVSDPEKVDALRETVFPEGKLNKSIVGIPAAEIAKKAGFTIPDDAKAMVVPPRGAGADDPFSREKLFPVIAAYKAPTWEECVAIAVKNLENEGIGHSANVHSYNDEHILYAGMKINVSRLLVNGIGSIGVGGSPQNGFVPTGTLGCGTWGGNSLSDNLTYYHLINTTKIGYTDETKPPLDPEVVWAK